MKTRNKLFLVALISFIFCGCDSFVSSSFENENPKDGKALLRVSIENNNSRTALPTLDWNEFSYELVAVQNPGEANQKEPKTLFNSRAYDQLIQGISLDAAKYKFTLNAYKNSQKVLSGNETVDLSSGNTTLSFMMYSVSGGNGSAVVKITYPKDNPVAKIVAYTSEEIFEEKTGVELSSKIVSGKMETSYEVQNLSSNKEQYAIIKFYDSNNTLVYSCAESLIIVGGCVSKSFIELTDEDWHTYVCTVTLCKDGSGWSSSEKSVSLVNKTNSTKIYPLGDSSGGKFKASVAEGIYYVYVNEENTGVEFNSVNKNINVNYFTVSMDAIKNCKMNPVSGGIDQSENSATIQEGKTFVYRLSLSKGYESNSLVVKQNGTVVPGADFDKDITIDCVNQPVKILVEGITPIVYTISYNDGGLELSPSKVSKLAYWYKYQSTYTPPTSFTAEETLVLPAIENIRKDNNYFDAWTDEDGNAVIDTEDVYKNLVLSANWKSAPKADDTNKVIYANGFNLLIKGNDTKNTQTWIYIDYNGNGIKDPDDTQIKCTNIATSKNDDFTGYELRAGSEDGSYVPKSDFTFTMTGGKISAIYGLNSRTQKYKNKSTLKISGTAMIGGIDGKYTVTNPDTTTTTYAPTVKGIMLDTLSSERVNIVDQMSNATDSAKTPYSVTCITENIYDRENEHIIADFANSNYANFSNFTCWNVNNSNPAEKKYTQIILSQKEEYVNSVVKTYVRLADDSGIVMPKANEVFFNEASGEFQFSSEVVQKPSSVFSLAIENGTFRVNERTTITKCKTDSDLAVEDSLTYMAQPTPLTYVERLSFDEDYVYMQVMSSMNLLNPLTINDFLQQLFIKKTDSTKAVKITLNIETVPAKFILGEGDGAGGSEYKYFNGSFYKRFDNNNDDTSGYNKVTVSGKETYLINWTNSYKKAKLKKFNGLTGYLMNITSEVENNYIYDTFYRLSPDQLSWAGGAAFVPVATMENPYSGETVYKFDQSTTSSSTDAAVSGARNYASKWYWQSGPEAGMCFWNTAVANDATNAANGKIEGAFERWNNSKYLHTDVYSSDINTKDPTKLIKGRECAEPNGPSTKTVNGVSIASTSEPCLQFLAGKLTPASNESYYANGFWNNQGDLNNQTSGYGCTGYIVEFTPYETIYGHQTASYQAIKRSASY